MVPLLYPVPRYSIRVWQTDEFVCKSANYSLEISRRESEDIFTILPGEIISDLQYRFVANAFKGAFNFQQILRGIDEIARAFPPSSLFFLFFFFFFVVRGFIDLRESS